MVLLNKNKIRFRLPIGFGVIGIVKLCGTGSPASFQVMDAVLSGTETSHLSCDPNGLLYNIGVQIFVRKSDGQYVN